MRKKLEFALILVVGVVVVSLTLLVFPIFTVGYQVESKLRHLLKQPH